MPTRLPRSIGFSLIALASVLAFACSAPADDEPLGCGSDSDCRDGRICDDGECVSSGGSSGTGGSGSSGTVTCGSTAVFSCTSPAASDFYSCHEFYTQAAADAVRDACISLGHTMTNGPCPSQFGVCCLSIDGSNGYPENACLWAADSADYQTWRELCVADADIVCG